MCDSAKEAYEIVSKSSLKQQIPWRFQATKFQNSLKIKELLTVYDSRIILVNFNVSLHRTLSEWTQCFIFLNWLKYSTLFIRMMTLTENRITWNLNVEYHVNCKNYIKLIAYLGRKKNKV